MLFTKLVALSFGVVPTLAKCVSASTTSSSAISTPIPTYLFTAHLQLGEPLKAIPLLEGGTITVEPIANGTISGPYLNGTILSGFATAIVVSNNTFTGAGKSIQIATINVYGKTTDGLSLYVREEGLGIQAGQSTRLIVAVGGKYRSLQTMFILGQPTPNAARTTVTVPCYSVPLHAGL